MLSTLANWTGRLIGETVHQTGEALDATWEGTKSIAEDISEIPAAFAQGYEEELFESKPEQTETTHTKAVTKPYEEQTNSN